MSKKTHWTISNRILTLRINIDWEKYIASGIVLPIDLGRCKDWHFETSEDVKVFVASWSMRRIKDLKKHKKEINEKVEPFTI